MLRRDTTATEQLMGPLVLMASFILITVMVIASMAAFLQTASGQWDEIRGTQIIGTTEYTLRNPVGGWDITSDNVTDRWDHEADENAYFYETEPGEDEQIVVGIIRDNAYFDSTYAWERVGYESMMYEDFIMVYTEFGVWSMDDWPISYETIIDNQVMNSNVSVTEFGLHYDTTFALIITVDAAGELFRAGVWNSDFNIKIGLPDFEADIAEASMWTILTQVMTASLPEVGDEVNLIIGATMYAGICMIVFTVISRMIPFISGG